MSCLAYISWQLLNWYGISGFVEVNGEVNAKEREHRLRRFRTDPKCRLLLLSGIGITGLNLAIASIMIIFVRSFQEMKQFVY